jgi:hypothetical protein
MQGNAHQLTNVDKPGTPGRGCHRQFAPHHHKEPPWAPIRKSVIKNIPQLRGNESDDVREQNISHCPLPLDKFVRHNCFHINRPLTLNSECLRCSMELKRACPTIENWKPKPNEIYHHIFTQPRPYMYRVNHRSGLQSQAPTIS